MRHYRLQKKTASVSFFCILYILFLNIFSFAEDGSRAEKANFIHPLILIDYDTASLTNNVGGISDGDEELPGTTYAMTIPDEGFARGNSGYSLRLDFDVSRLGEYSFYWMKLGKGLSAKNDATAVLDLRNYNYLSFWVKGAQDLGNIKVELHQDIDEDGAFAFGKDITGYVYANAYIRSGAITREWQKVLVPLKAFTAVKDWSKMLELVLVFENRSGDRKGTVYIDDILFGFRPEEILNSKEIQEIKPPIEQSFRINGKKSIECTALSGLNRMQIKSEDINENPFIESVRFQYSADKANTWKTIATDYDVGKKEHRINWRIDDVKEFERYMVTAVATDIHGNEAIDGILMDCGVKPMTDDEFLNLVERKAFDFFNEHQSSKTGLFADTTGSSDASIAVTGFGLAALCIGAEKGWIDKKEAKERALLALDAFLPQGPGKVSLAEGRYGFFYHFLNMNTGKRAGKSEISTVDTAILVAGAITAGEYFGGDLKLKADELYKRVEWERFLSKEPGPMQNTFSMGWSPERGFLESSWDYYTDEVILIALLAIGSPTHPVTPDAFYAWTRHKGAYGAGKPFIYSWHGSLFSYQYAHAWFNLQGLVDKNGVSWFENSINATLANRQFSIDNQDKFKGYGPNSWGITSMARPGGYTMHFGVPPTGSGDSYYDGTISPTGPAGSIVFTPYLSISALKYMYLTHPRLWGQYGFKDSFNLDSDWYASTYYGIGVAMILIPIENFRSGLIWNNFMRNKYMKDALAKANFTKVRR